MMKKLISIVLAVMMAASAFALSYKNNTYQKLAEDFLYTDRPIEPDD